MIYMSLLAPLFQDRSLLINPHLHSNTYDRNSLSHVQFWSSLRGQLGVPYIGSGFAINELGYCPKAKIRRLSGVYMHTKLSGTSPHGVNRRDQSPLPKSHLGVLMNELSQSISL